MLRISTGPIAILSIKINRWHYMYYGNRIQVVQLSGSSMRKRTFFPCPSFILANIPRMLSVRWSSSAVFDRVTISCSGSRNYAIADMSSAQAIGDPTRTLPCSTSLTTSMIRLDRSLPLSCAQVLIQKP
jgi:hypothetical protein